MARQKDSSGGRHSSRSKPGFDEGIEQLEAILDEIESGEAPLEQCLKRYEQGVKLAKHCQSILDQAQRRIAELAPTQPMEAASANGPDQGRLADDGISGDE